MPVIRLRFAGDLNQFLLPVLRGREIERDHSQTDTLMHVIESVGVPHTEVGRVASGDGVTVIYPAEPECLEDPRFVLDGHLARLARYLRMLGFDVWHAPHPPDEELAAISSQEGRVLLTRDVGLLKRREVRRGYFVRATDPRLQLEETVRRFGLYDPTEPFTRCPRCNTELRPVAKDAVVDRLPPRTAELYNEFMQCPTCERVYWKGSHYDRMRAWIERLRSSSSEAEPGECS